MRLPVIVSLAAIWLAGCATPAQQAAQMSREVDSMVQIYGPACDKLGYKNGTDAWRNCVLQLSMKDDYYRTPYPYYGPAYPYWWY